MKLLSENNSGDVNNHSARARIFHPFAPGMIIHIAPESLFTSPRNDYSHAPESAINRVGDINGDGIPDIVCSTGQFLFGRGDGTFSLSTRYEDLYSADFELLDLNGDGNLDILGLDFGNTSSLGVAFGNGDGTFSTPTSYPIPDQTDLYLAVGDFNGDGIPDAATIGDQGVWLLTGKGGGEFNSPVLVAPTIVGSVYARFRAADMNGDGKLDLVVSAIGGVSILFGNGDGTFQSPVNYGGSYNGCNVTVADINSDGYLDVVCTTSQNIDTIVIYLGKAGGELRQPYLFALSNGGDVEVGDVNGDGIPDLVSDVVEVAYGLGKGKFSSPVSFPTYGLASQVVLANLRSPKVINLVTNATFVADTVLLNKGDGRVIEGITTPVLSGLDCGTELDFNGDGIADIGFLDGPNFVIEYGTGKIGAPFTTGPSSPVPQNAGYTQICPSNLADLNGDGIPDLLIPEVNSSGTVTLLVPFFGTGNGNFSAGVPFTTSGENTNPVIADVNGDGKADLITPNSNQLWYGNGDGTFQAPVQLVSNPNKAVSSVWVADVNGDGVSDLVVQLEDGGNTVFLESNGHGGLTQTQVGDFPDGYVYDAFAVGLGDLNGDGYPDLVVGSALNSMGIYVNDGKGNFAFFENIDVSGLILAPEPLVLDVNGDGLNDIVVSDGDDIAVLTN
jgi:hypothetical protein